ncbi:MAG: cytochrome c oxidase subunit I [Chloroflexi bacterium AL-W]|nr:cytochrome c oxidase subunit I [Chloroflexi bacterium AL-N1]NOK68421.1 cytochrome c oxidase subunit I [Chloroflexi bacterium AL-N10]NOK74067.1 cytochrome c oxidase subunit I [Chloroflexi bacterium AL-N5]NOK83034.1 cytochrome c oxidase subunit I [Chloroflexi bacterium AL-W]NOK90557.1 cytochrome c oxidase subunit I [Chloroflexi bacterium AL-N15]
MTTLDQPVEQPTIGTVSPTTKSTGWASWFSTVDHKKIGIMYMLSAFVFLVIGGIEALLMRIQLGVPDNTFLNQDLYNQLFTMHGTTMVFLAVMPLNTGIGNYIVPLMIGARDMAFPRLNAMSIWLFILGGLMLYASFILGGAPNAGWFSYAPLTMREYSPTHGMEYWIMGLTLTGVASIAGSVNFVVTILNMRAPGMTINRMPLFVWMMLVTSFILLFAFPVLTAAQIMLLFDRNFGTGFFNPEAGGNPILWQHLFWFFGHPEVYIMILPVFGIISEILPTFSRKPIFGYAFIAYSGVAIGFLGFLVWTHHMFAVGLGPLVNAFFAGASFLIAIPTGVKIFNWIATLWGGSINLKAPLYYAVGFIAMFIIGGISGITLASPPVNLQQTDSYYVVAHFHYVLFGGALWGIFAGAFYWFPKMTGRMMSERLAKIQFWIMLVSFNVTFFPMHIVGTQGMPRRIPTYTADQEWAFWNLLETIGAFGIALAVLLFTWNLIVSLRAGKRASADPWDGSTLEWATTSPPPEYNFATEPQVYSRRPLWDIKYPELSHNGKRQGKAKKAEAAEEPVDPSTIHLPSPTYQPLIVSLGLTIFSFGVVYLGTHPTIGVPLVVVGLLIFAVSVVGWVGDSYKDRDIVH